MNFPLNYQTLMEIDTTPNATTRNWVPVAEGIVSSEKSMNDVLDTKSYYSDKGYSSTRKTGGQLTVTLSGDRVVGDAAQDFIASTAMAFGDDAKTNARLTDFLGEQKTGEVTIGEVVAEGGDANTSAAFSATLYFNGEPTVTPKVTATALTAVVAAGSVAGTTKFTATAGAGNILAYKLTPQTAGTIYNLQYVAGVVKPYTSGSNILASVGQYLQMYELDTNGRVVKFVEDLLASGDFPA